MAVAMAALLLLVGAAETVAKSINRAPRFHHRAMTAQQIRRAARANCRTTLNAGKRLRRK